MKHVQTAFIARHGWVISRLAVARTIGDDGKPTEDREDVMLYIIQKSEPTPADLAKFIERCKTGDVECMPVSDFAKGTFDA